VARSSTPLFSCAFSIVSGKVAAEEAVEKAVFGLVMEGAELALWNFADASAAEPIRALYRDERDGIYEARDVQTAYERAGSFGALTIVDKNDDDDD
jgi:curli production assembly/transport component CsgG